MSHLQSALHGGDIVSASAQYNINQSDWIDLSTGLNPDSYPVEGIPPSAFNQLSYLQPDFMAAAQGYYGSEHGMALIGSQMIIQALPKCVERHPVLLPSAGYAEHRDHWLKNDFQVHSYDGFSAALASEQISEALRVNPKQHLVIINPNNPTGMLIGTEQILTWAKALGAGCYLVLDEAFIDTQQDQSLLKQAWPDNLLVLRSFGKFFGLAGIRIGFAFCQGRLRERIEEVLGLWMINGPAQYLATKAMKDINWQQQAKLQIAEAGALTQKIFAPLIGQVQSEHLTNKLDAGSWSTHQALFSSYQMRLQDALAIQDYFARSGILLRVIQLAELNSDCAALLRVGILSLKDKAQQQRVADCVAGYLAEH